MTHLNARRFFFAFGLMVFFAFQSQAADITGYVGGVMPGKLPSSQGLTIALDKSPIFGFRLATNFIPMFGLEHTLAFSSDYLFPHNAAAITNARGFVYNSNLIVNVPVHRAVPYVTAGVGLIHQYGSPTLPVGTKFAFNYGGGLKFPKLFGPLGLRFDVRGYTAMGVFSQRLNMVEVTGGVLLSFGH
jgi:hypothetical protein